MIFQKFYIEPEYNRNRWSIVDSKENIVYTGKEKLKLLREYGISGGYHGKIICTYKYNNGLLIAELMNGEIQKGYSYNNQKQLVEETAYSGSKKIGFSKFFYNSFGLKKKSINYSSSDKIFSIDTFIYDSHNKIIDHITYDSTYNIIAREIMLRDRAGRIEELKWSDHYGYTAGSDYEKHIQREYMNTQKYFYDKNGRLVKIEQYYLDKFIREYLYEYSTSWW